MDIILTGKKGEVVLKVESGEMTISTDSWDYNIEGRTIHIRSALGDIELKLILRDDGVIVRKGYFVEGTTELVIEPNHYTVGGVHMSGCKISGCRTGLAVG